MQFFIGVARKIGVGPLSIATIFAHFACSDYKFNEGVGDVPKKSTSPSDRTYDAMVSRDEDEKENEKEQIEPVEPKKGCQAHFSGIFWADRYEWAQFNHIYIADNYSEYVGAGYYESNYEAFPNSIDATFDSLAIDANTTVIIYARPNFKGRVLFEKTGPALLYNNIWQFYEPETLQLEFYPELQKQYPPEVREWSLSDMHLWDQGSTIIKCK